MGKRKGLGKADIQPILDELKAGLQAIYGPRLRQVILFGSYARGEADGDSDIDVAIVVDDYRTAFEEILRTDAVAGPLSLDTDTLIVPLHVREAELRDPREPTYRRICAEGVPA